MRPAVSFLAPLLILWSLASLAFGLWWCVDGWAQPHATEKGLWAQWEFMKSNGVADAEQLLNMFPDMSGYHYSPRVDAHYDTPLHTLFGPYIDEISNARTSAGVALVVNGVVLLAAGIVLHRHSLLPKLSPGTPA